MKRREIFAGNWKMHKSFSEAEKLVKAIISGMGDPGEREVAIFPPFPYVRDIVKLCENTGVDVGMQNMHYEKEGAFTGEVSPLMVKDSGCRYVLIGHSERRHVFGESDGDVNKKIASAFDTGIDPLLCVGELIAEREKGKTEEVIERQIRNALSGIESKLIDKLIVAYEPVWAIGTGKVATPDIAEEVHLFIRGLVRGLYGDETSESLPILYGGSVKPGNIEGLYKMENIDGVLVGGASLEADSFLEIIKVS